jgi:hypothetical protein
MFNFFRSASAAPQAAPAPSPLKVEEPKKTKTVSKAPSALEVAEATIAAEAKAKADAEKKAAALAAEALRADEHVARVKVAAATLANARKESEAAYGRLLVQKGATNVAAARAERADQALLALVRQETPRPVGPVVIPIGGDEPSIGNIPIEWDEPEQAPVVAAAAPVANAELEAYFELYGV